MGMVTVTARGEQLELRPFTLADTTDYYDLVRDPAIAASAGFTPAHSLTEAEFLLKQQAKLPQIFAIELVAYHRAIGSVGLYERMTNAGEPATLEMDLGYMLNARYWHRGIMTAAVARILQYGFKTLHLRRITASCLANNPASQQILVHANFRQYDAVRHPDYAPFGAGQTELFYDCVELNP
ncbi:GNAT family N-acetyltransferase [Lactiplantibacillus paraplantarum]|uniref:GNAT family N-acetyltransferase n=1 Tax=Lactiplantibacillus paraplantarum TaxID=60520 RepID=UPI000512D2B1|nr:GNAT family N-acetyltransferase [Lactiplantibacillus paraplantarum]OAX75785.1 GNAT family acetyltransferase [Lactiplantibacillus plantarum]ALO03064.1 GNAT family acetyltransferase [Lactiplantibacillus paraplantarum]KGE74864.1 GNAT family acetyltransferase [Lactiplantibacillus paraplantarum]MCW1909623.1 GNAT family N-acetyltransferase [Lactiplantibacillus paraplantarum]RDG09978.1 N-acetyltransferase [Lactiplantibacillus paraplantarum]